MDSPLSKRAPGVAAVARGVQELIDRRMLDTEDKAPQQPYVCFQHPRKRRQRRVCGRVQSCKAGAVSLASLPEAGGGNSKRREAESTWRIAGEGGDYAPPEHVAD
jgi:hypothetical protein